MDAYINFIIYYIGLFYVAFQTADFISGFVHWLEDSWCWEEIDFPVITLVCDENIGHHKDPTNMNDSTFISRNWKLWALCSTIFSIMWLCGVGTLFWFIVLFLCSFGNEIHTWNHNRILPVPLMLMRKAHLFQDMQQHSLHHKYVDTHYCPIGSQLNPFLDYFKFWRGLEWCVTKVTGIKPTRYEVIKKSK